MEIKNDIFLRKTIHVFLENVMQLWKNKLHAVKGKKNLTIDDNKTKALCV